jgi:predicted RNA-binding Zn ribbon-like protein
VSQEAPGALELVRAFVNSVDLEDGVEELSDPEALGAWLRARELLPADAPAPGPADLRRAIELREALRELLLAHHGDHALDPRAVEVVDAAARRAHVGLRFGADGRAEVQPGREGVDGALGRLLAIVAAAQADGTWERLKACPWDTCRWAFYDHSRNRSGVWCSMAVCGNRAKVQAFRERQERSRPSLPST